MVAAVSSCLGPPPLQGHSMKEPHAIRGMAKAHAVPLRSCEPVEAWSACLPCLGMLGYRIQRGPRLPQESCEPVAVRLRIEKL